MSADVILAVSDVVKVFGSLRALDGVNLEVREGEIVGLVGPNGSGKSTLINVLSGYLPLNGGRAVFGGARIDRMAPHKIAESGLARTYQIPRPFSTLTTLENVAIGGYFGRREPRRPTAERAMELLAFVGLEDRAHVAAEHLTLHQRKQLELARALACRPRLVMLDEVLAGLNPSEIESAIDLVMKIRDTGVAVIFVEHNMRAVLSLSDRLVVLQSGTVIAEGEPDDVLRRDEVIDAYLGRSHA